MYYSKIQLSHWFVVIIPNYSLSNHEGAWCISHNLYGRLGSQMTFIQSKLLLKMKAYITMFRDQQSQPTYTNTQQLFSRQSQYKLCIHLQYLYMQLSSHSHLYILSSSECNELEPMYALVLFENPMQCTHIQPTSRTSFLQPCLQLPLVAELFVDSKTLIQNHGMLQSKVQFYSIRAPYTAEYALCTFFFMKRENHLIQMWTHQFSK